ncbi:MAG: ParB/RepB/Spo0J family partition protein [Candidatus Paceibacteria bacterium]
MALGKGLDSLIQSEEDTQQKSEDKSQSSSGLDIDSKTEATTDHPESSNRVIEVSIEKIKPNPHQPRENFPEDKLEELASSIAEYGVMQPVTVSPLDSGGYELIAGERRFRASRKADQETIPAIIKDTTEKEQMELALIENLHRHDLSPIEEAQAYRGLIHKFELTQSEVADRVGKSRSNVANMLRLLELPEDIKQALDEERIAIGQARALLSLDSEVKQLEAFERLLSEDLNVREIEQYIKDGSEKSKSGGSKSNSSAKRRKDPNIIAKEEEMEAKLGTKVNIERNDKGEGEIKIDFYSSEDLKRILEDIL